MLRNSRLQKKSVEIVKAAEIEGENIKKEKIFQAKEKYLQLKSEHEAFVNEKNAQLQQTENKLRQRELQLNQQNSDLIRKAKENDTARENRRPSQRKRKSTTSSAAR